MSAGLRPASATLCPTFPCPCPMRSRPSGASTSEPRPRSWTRTSSRSCSSSARPIEAGLQARSVGGWHGLLKSNGGGCRCRHASDRAIEILLSGLAGGMLGGAYWARSVGSRGRSPWTWAERAPTSAWWSTESSMSQAPSTWSGGCRRPCPSSTSRQSAPGAAPSHRSTRPVSAGWAPRAWAPTPDPHATARAATSRP